MCVPEDSGSRPLPMGVPRRAPGLDSDLATARAWDLSEKAVKLANELFCGADVSLGESAGDECHLRAFANVFGPASRMAADFDPDVSWSAAFSDIGGGLDYRGVSTSFIPLDESLVALGPEGAEPLPYSRLLGPSGLEEVQNFISSSVLPISEGQEACRSAGLSRPFLDPGIRSSPRRRHNFFRKLARHNIITWIRFDLHRWPLHCC